MIAIIAILAGMLLPALNKAREKAHSVSCLGNLRQMGLFWQNYTNESQDWIAPYYDSTYNTPGKTYLQLYTAQGVMDWNKHWKVTYCPSWTSTEQMNAQRSGTNAQPGSHGYGMTYQYFKNYQKLSNLMKTYSGFSSGKRDGLAGGVFADSVVYLRSYRDQYYCLEVPSGTPATNAKLVHTRHNNNANLLFIPGHATAVSYSFLRANYDYPNAITNYK